MVRMTFTLDDPTVAALRMSAARLGRPRSEIVRLAIRDYAGRVGKLTEPERLRLLHLFDEVVPRIPSRPAAAVDRESGLSVEPGGPEAGAGPLGGDPSRHLRLLNALTGPRRSAISQWGGTLDAQ